jgi:cyclohexyl-isocyanide hydratase
VIRAAFGFSLVPHVALEKCPPLEVICVPGGSGVDRLLSDEEVIAFLRRQARTARYVTSVCTGSLLLGAAGLLKGRRAACHWLSLPLLAVFGAKPSQRRIERDGKYITAGGITAGIDFGLWLAAKLAGTAVAKEIQLMMQYDPKPPFRAGTPRQAGKALAGRVVRSRSAAQAEPTPATSRRKTSAPAASTERGARFRARCCRHRSSPGWSRSARAFSSGAGCNDARRAGRSHLRRRR